MPDGVAVSTVLLSCVCIVGMHRSDIEENSGLGIVTMGLIHRGRSIHSNAMLGPFQRGFVPVYFYMLFDQGVKLFFPFYFTLGVIFLIALTEPVTCYIFLHVV